MGPALIQGLKNLEYRGYDAAGFAVVRDGELIVRKVAGRVAQLEVHLPDADGAHVGMAHTRWATHGAPTQANAHPHVSADGRFAVVHNGIIENYRVLRELLEQRGVHFASETDSETVAHLIMHEWRGDTLAAVYAAAARLKGTFGLLVIDRDEPGRLIAVRQGSPLVIGVAEGELFAASDASAIVQHTRQVIYLEDGEVAELTLEGYKTSTFDHVDTTRRPEAIDWEIEAIERGGFEHFMLKEIFEQPAALRNTFAGRLRPEEGEIVLGGIRNLSGETIRGLKRVILTGCGTAWHAGLVGEYAIEELARLNVEVEYASEFRYRNPVVGPGDLLIAISQSGETADTLAALREARLRGAEVMGICNVVGSTIAREAGVGVYTHAGPEIGVASTKAFTAQVAVLLMLAIQWGRMRGELTQAAAAELTRELARVPDLVGRVCAQTETIKEIAAELAGCQNALYLGRGPNFPIALEGALKLKEISYIHAEGYPAAEMKHGPIALIDERMPVVVVTGHDEVNYEKTISNIQEIRARSGRVFAVASEGDGEIGRLAERVIEVPAVHPLIAPLVNVVPLQLLAYHIAALRGCEIDKPRNLAKSVTVE